MVPQNYIHLEIPQRPQVGTCKDINKWADLPDACCYGEQRIASEESLMDAKHQDAQGAVSINSRRQESIRSSDIKQRNETERYESVAYSDTIHTGKMPLDRYRSATSTWPAVLCRLIKYDKEYRKDGEAES